MTINPQMRKVNREIDKLLRERRPDRYAVRDTASDTTDLDAEEVETTTWLDDIAKEVEPIIPEETSRRLFARSLVGQREGQKTRSGNKALRNIDRDGQEPLDWEWLDDPIAVITRHHEPGESRVKIIEERVALRAATPKDLRDFAIEERRRAADEFTTRNETSAAAEWLADDMTTLGAGQLIDWARQHGADI